MTDGHDGHTGHDHVELATVADEQARTAQPGDADRAPTLDQAGAPPDPQPHAVGREVPRRGAAVLELVEVMDRLRSPGGCPWDAEQTHASLAPYAVEEAYELAEAIEHGAVCDIVDELGDVLLQVVFQARVGQDGPDPFDIDDVARGIVAKMRRRHPHVFDGVAVTGAAEVEANWDVIKAGEKPDRTGPLDGIPTGMPPLERATKMVSRLDRAGLLPAADLDDDSIGARMLALVVQARGAGVDPAAELRATLIAVERRIGTGRQPSSTEQGTQPPA